MRLRFNLGAIVEIILFGEEKSKTVTGKVVSVMDDEVQICPQLRVKREREVSDWHFSEDPNYRQDISVDANDIIHLNRQLIKSWKYVHINELNKKDAVNEEKDMIPEKVSKILPKMSLTLKQDFALELENTAEISKNIMKCQL